MTGSAKQSRISYAESWIASSHSLPCANALRLSQATTEKARDLQCQRLHLTEEIGFSFEADTGKIWHRDVPIFHAHTVRETAIGLEQVGIALVAAEPETGGDIERHLMSAMRDAAARAPTRHFKHLERALIFAKPVRQGAIEL